MTQASEGVLLKNFPDLGPVTSATRLIAETGGHGSHFIGAIARFLGVAATVQASGGDDTAAIKAAVASAQAAGGGMVRLVGMCRIADTIEISASGVGLVGDGYDTYHDFTPTEPNQVNSRNTTSLLWTGANGGTMVRFAAAGPAGLGGCRFSGIMLVAGTYPFTSRADYGVEVGAVRGSHFDLVGIECGVAALRLKSQNRSGSAENSPKFNTISYIGSRNLSTAGGALRCEGVSGIGNAYNNLFHVIDAVHSNGVAVDLYSADNNVFLQTRIQRAAGGTGYGVVFRSGATADDVARSNVFHLLSPGAGGVVADGALAGKSYENKILFYNPDENGAPARPTVDGNATLFYGSSKRLGGMNVQAGMPAVQTVPAGVSTVLNFSDAFYDPATWFDTAAKRWRPRYPGTYLVTAQATATPGPQGDGSLFQLSLIQSSGASWRGLRGLSGLGSQTVSVTALCEMAAGETIEAQFRHDSGGTATVLTNRDVTFFQATRIV